MGLKDKLTLIQNAKNGIRNKIIDKGVHVPESAPLTDYPNYINNICQTPIQMDTDQWTPDPLWWDIETILANDTNEGDNAWLDECGKCIVLYDDELDTQEFAVCKNTVVYDGKAVSAVKTSDGQLYIGTSTGSDGDVKTHTWDKTKDKESSLPDKKTRYAIFYKSKEIKLKNNNNLFRNCLYVVNDGIHFLGTESNVNYTCGYLSIQAYKELSGNIAAEYGGRMYFHAQSMKYIELNSPHTTEQLLNGHKMIIQNAKVANVKLGNDAYHLTNDLKTYDVFTDSAGCSCSIILDVTDIDFTDCHNQIFINTYFSKIKGIINLENNTLNTNYSLFEDGDYYYTPCVYCLNLPPNADVTIYTRWIAKETAKYLVENAPTITEAHTLQVPAFMYTTLKNLPHDCPVTYNGQQYSDGVQVLTLKGWTVKQI
jgi:hypothetical protein